MTAIFSPALIYTRKSKADPHFRHRAMNHTQHKKDNNPISNGLNPKENHRIFAAG